MTPLQPSKLMVNLILQYKVKGCQVKLVEAVGYLTLRWCGRHRVYGWQTSLSATALLQRYVASVLGGSAAESYLWGNQDQVLLS